MLGALRFAPIYPRPRVNIFVLLKQRHCLSGYLSR